MKPSKIPNPSKLIASLAKGPKIIRSCIFWNAFYLADGDAKDARKILHTVYFPDNPEKKPSSRATMLYALSAGLPPLTKNMGWVELFAAAGLSDAINELCRSQCIEPIHALHAEIEHGSRLFPNPGLRVKRRQREWLLELYDIEAALFEDQPNPSIHLKHWFEERRRRALAYFDMLDFCKDDKRFHEKS